MVEAVEVCYNVVSMRLVLGHRRGGFNLLEVTVAAFIFSVVAISFVGVWGQQVRALEKSRHVMVATFLAEELIEESMTKGYEQSKVTDPADPTTSELDPIEMSHYNRDPQGVWQEMKVFYTATRVVKEYKDPDPSATDPDKDKIKQVIVTVKWEDTTKTGEVVLETFLAGAQ